MAEIQITSDEGTYVAGFFLDASDFDTEEDRTKMLNKIFNAVKLACQVETIIDGAPRVCYGIFPDVLDVDGGFIPVIFTEGESGYYQTDWNWGTDVEIANALANRHNQKLGLTREDVAEIVKSTL